MFSPVKKQKEPWSPKQNIWSGKNDKKRKAEEARLSSNEESSKKRVDSKTTSITGSEGWKASSFLFSSSVDISVSSSTRDVMREENTSYVDSRPSSSVAVAAPPDISCSPIISPEQGVGEGEKSKTGGGESERKTSTSTPLGTFSSRA